MQSNFKLLKAVLALSVSASGAAIAIANPLDETQDVAVTAIDIPMGQEFVKRIAGFGTPKTRKDLTSYRGGFDLVKNDMQLTGTVANNAATNVVTGSNYITDGAFTNSAGFPTVIQNSGSNVLIQNATIVNLQMQ